MEYLRSSSRRTLPASRRKGTSSLPSGRASSPPEVKLPEGSRRKPKEAKDALPSGGSEGRPSFGRKPPEVKLPEGRSEKSCFLREPLALPSESARGEASRRKPKDVLFSKQVRFLRLSERSLTSGGFLRKAATPPEVKLPEGSRQRFFQKAEGRPSFGRKPKDVLFSKQVRFLRKAEGRAFFKTSSSSRQR